MWFFGPVGVFACVSDLCTSELVAEGFEEEAGFVDTPEVFSYKEAEGKILIPDLFCCCLLRLSTIGGNGVSDLICDSSSCCACSENNHSHISELQVTDMKTGHYRCECDASSSLHVVVEAWDL